MNNILIIFPSFNLSFSPTILNLFAYLKQKGVSVTIVGIIPDSKFDVKLINDPNIIYLNRLNFFEKIYYSIKYYLISFFGFELKYGRYRYKRQCNLYKEINKNKLINKYTQIIAVDADTYCFFRNKNLFNKISFLSLEIQEADSIIPFIQKNVPEFSIFQSEIRYKYYFNEQKEKKFLLPNSPVFFNYDCTLYENRRGYVYTGAAIEEFGIFDFLNLSDYNLNEKLIVKGYFKGEDLIKFENISKNDNIIFNSEYLSERELILFLNKCRIGFCLYDDRFPKIQEFNYRTAPSGKLFSYLLAGIPVICTNQPAFDFISSRGCGIQVNSLNADDLLNAILRIEKNYEFYANNSLNTSREYDFNSFAKPIYEELSRQ